MSEHSVITSNALADMPKDQVEYFKSDSRSPSKAAPQTPPQAFVHPALACPHGVRRSPFKGRNAHDLANAREARQPSTINRPDIFERYKQYFTGTNTPMFHSHNQSERSTSCRSENDSQYVPASSTQGVYSITKPQLTPQLQVSNHPNSPWCGPGGNSNMLQEPQKQKPASSVRSAASSIYSVSSNHRPDYPQQKKQHQAEPARVTTEKSESVHTVSSHKPESHRAPQLQGEVPVPHREPTSVSTRASEPQVVSCQQYNPNADRAEGDSIGLVNEKHVPNRLTQPGEAENFTIHRASHNANNIDEIPAPVKNDHNNIDCGGFSCHSESVDGPPENAYMQPSVSRETKKEPPRRPSYSRMSHSTASVATVSSAHYNNDRGCGFAETNRTESVRDDDATDIARHHGTDHDSVNNEDEKYNFKPAINSRSRNLAHRRPDYGQDAFDRLNNDADYVRKAMIGKEKYAEGDDSSEHILMPPMRAYEGKEDQEYQRTSDDGVFSRLYTDAKRYNNARANRERQLEIQRMRNRGEIYDDDEGILEGSQETAQPGRPSRGNREDGDGNDAEGDEYNKQKSSQSKRKVDFEIFDRLSKPLTVVQKYTQMKELEQQQLGEAEKRAHEARAEEMESIAKYTWDVPAASFSMADLQRQNSLFVS